MTTFNEMLVNCNFKCQICDIEHSQENPLFIDHCHETKKVRGLLCRRCNHGLGFFKDKIDLMNKAIKYLEDGNI